MAVGAVALFVVACDATPPVTFTPSVAPTSTPVASASPAPTPASSPTRSSTPTPTPAPTTPPTPAPSSSPVAAGWPYEAPSEISQTLLPDDGRVVVVENDFGASRSSMVTLDGAGQPMAGWPWSPDTGGDIQRAALGPDGSIYVVVRGLGTSDFESTWSLHRLSTEAQEASGFPVELPNASFCTLDAPNSGVAYVTCENSDDNGDTTGTTLSAFGGDGSPAFAAPLSLPGSATLIGFGNDQLPVVAIPAGRRTVIRALASDGTTRWATATIPGSATLDTAGRVRITRQQFEPDACGAPLRTTYALIGADGTPAAGWPVSVAGWASAPAVLQDGSAVVVTAGGRAIRYTLRGTIARGWPVRAIEVSFACFDGTAPVSDGHRVVVVGGQRVTVLRPSGSVPAGWPANPPGQNAEDCPGCTPGSGAMLAPVITLGPTTYVATYDPSDRARVATIGSAGTVENQVVVGARGDIVTGLLEAPTGRIWAVTRHDEGDGSTGTLSLVADPPAAP